jgi:hypothetical protein
MALRLTRFFFPRWCTIVTSRNAVQAIIFLNCSRYFNIGVEELSTSVSVHAVSHSGSSYMYQSST